MAVASVSTPASVALSPRRGLAIAGYLGGALLGVVLLVAVWAKAIDPTAFVEQIRADGLEILLPARAIAFAVLALETGLGVALLLNLRRLPVLLTASALVLFFLVLTGRNWWRTEHGLLEPGSACGCFGNLVERTPQEAFWSDLLLLVPGLALAWVGRPGATTAGAQRFGLAAVAATGAVLFAWRSPSLPLDDLATRLRPGVELASLCAGIGAERVCLTHLVPELATGSHMVVLADVRAPEFADIAGVLNARADAGSRPEAMVLADFTAEEQRALLWSVAPAFDLHETPAAMLRPLYRTLPRSFRVEDGRVVETWSGLPPDAAPASEPAN
jgi:Methylamine utilisation protein MauE